LRIASAGLTVKADGRPASGLTFGEKPSKLQVLGFPLERKNVSDKSTGLINIRVYYEDTDFSGRVYHASYLRFLERGRTEWLRSFGFAHRELAASNAVTFAVRRLQIEYRAAALMDDWLDVETRASRIRGASLEFHQRVARDGQELVTATVLVAAIRGDRPARIPESLRRAIGHRANES